jgi:diguanylate cyclase (GGDEF)-like protein
MDALGAALPYVAAVLEKIDVGAMLLAGDRVCCANRMIGALLGLAEDQLLGMTVDDLLSHVIRIAVDPPPCLRDRRLMQASEGVVCEEFEIGPPDHGFVRWTTQAVRLPSGSALLVTCADITADAQLVAVSLRLAETDSLTALPNRRGMRRRIVQEVARARRTSRPLSLLALDVDHFKEVNDRSGHAAGDAVLRSVAKVLSDTLRGHADAAGRWGGEEFMVLLPGSTMSGAQGCAERLRRGVSELRVGDVRVTVSIGVAELGANEDMDALLRRADAQLYEAKRGGRNRVC